MGRLCEESLCTGCGACIVSCPRQCISFRIGELGHKFPAIDNTDCIDCGVCSNKCPVLNPVELYKPNYAYAAWSKNEDLYKTSTSGAISAELSSFVIEQGGVVYGCAYCEDVTVRHIRIDNQKDLHRIQGSKYAQSDITEAIIKIKEDLKKGLVVLFLGTPCQIAAIRKTVKGSLANNLVLVDILCYGVPSNKLLKDYLVDERHLKLHDITKVTFRDEEQYVLKVYSNDDVILEARSRWAKDNSDDDLFLNMFTYRHGFRSSCFTCRYHSKERISDLTIGDFWGLNKTEYKKDIPERPHGVSLILVNNEKGRQILDKVKSRLNIFERPLEEAYTANGAFDSNKEVNIYNKLFRLLYPVLGSRQSYDACVDIFEKVKKQNTK